MNPMLNNPGSQSGISMIEVLVTMLILMVGLLGLAGLQMQGLRSEMESYQRVQALILLQDMVGRINANRANAANYVADNIGTGAIENCAGLSGQLLDFCEWGNALRGAGETSGGGTSVGAMIGGRGCITRPGGANIYQVSVAWQGLGQTFAPTNLCGQNQYGNETQRRVISLALTIGTLLAP